MVISSTRLDGTGREPRLFPGCCGIQTGLSTVLFVECFLLVGQVVLSIYTAFMFRVLPGLLTFVVIGVGVWALIRVFQAKRDQDGNLLTVYIIWKSILVTLQAIGVIAAAVALGIMANKQDDSEWAQLVNSYKSFMIAALIVAAIYVVLGIAFLVFVSRCRVHFRRLQLVAIQQFATTAAATDYPHYYTPYPAWSIPTASLEGIPAPVSAAPPAYDNVMLRAENIPPPAYKEKIDDDIKDRRA